VIAATGIYVPPNSISNAELVGAFNAYVERFNAVNATAIAAGEIAPLLPSSVEFIEKASGIKSRYVMDKQGILDPAIMRPMIPERPNDQISILAEMAVAAAEDALKNWGGSVGDIGAVICAASNMQRPYPAMSVEIQNALGIGGFAFDMNVACSSATFGIKTAQQDLDWAEIVQVWRAADETASIEHAWLFDHFAPINGNLDGPCVDGWTALAALAAETKRVRLGLMVTGNTYRHPAILAKIGAHTRGEAVAAARRG